MPIRMRVPPTTRFAPLGFLHGTKFENKLFQWTQVKAKIKRKWERDRAQWANILALEQRVESSEVEWIERRKCTHCVQRAVLCIVSVMHQRPRRPTNIARNSLCSSLRIGYVRLFLVWCCAVCTHFISIRFESLLSTHGSSVLSILYSIVCAVHTKSCNNLLTNTNRTATHKCVYTHVVMHSHTAVASPSLICSISIEELLTVTWEYATWEKKRSKYCCLGIKHT